MIFKEFEVQIQYLSVFLRISFEEFESQNCITFHYRSFLLFEFSKAVTIGTTVNITYFKFEDIYWAFILITNAQADLKDSLRYCSTLFVFLVLLF